MLSTAQWGLGSCCVRKSAKFKAKLDKCQQDKGQCHEFNQSQQEDPADNVEEARMTVLSRGMYHHY